MLADRGGAAGGAALGLADEDGVVLVRRSGAGAPRRPRRRRRCSAVGDVRVLRCPIPASTGTAGRAEAGLCPLGGSGSGPDRLQHAGTRTAAHPLLRQSGEAASRPTPTAAGAAGVLMIWCWDVRPAAWAGEAVAVGRTSWRCKASVRRCRTWPALLEQGKPVPYLCRVATAGETAYRGP